MRFLKTLGVCLAATFALSVLTAASASAKGLAGPLLGKGCKSQAGGNYGSSKCTKPSPVKKGKFEWEEATKKGFTSEGGLATLEAKSGGKIESPKHESSGEIVGPIPVGGPTKFAKVVVKYKEVLVLGVFPCTSGPPAGAKEVWTKPLVAETGYVRRKPAPLIAGELFKPEAGEFLATFVCGPASVEVKGSIIAESKPVNAAPSTTGEVVAEKGSKPGEQKIQCFEAKVKKRKVTCNEAKHHLEASASGGAYEEFSQEQEDKVTFEEPLTLRG